MDETCNPSDCRKKERSIYIYQDREKERGQTDRQTEIQREVGGGGGGRKEGGREKERYMGTKGAN